MRIPKYKYDAFISHAVEDKIPFANDLERALSQRGAKLWYSGKELGAGDTLDDAIRDGLHQSRYGIIIVSPVYLRKIWTLTEFAAFFLRERDGGPVLLPVLLDIKLDELDIFSPIVKKYCIQASLGPEAVADRLMAQMQKLTVQTKEQEQKKRRKQFLQLGIPVLLAIILLLGIVYYFTRPLPVPDDATIIRAIEKRVTDVTRLAEVTVAKSQGTQVVVDIKKEYARHINLKASYRNLYSLNTGLASYNSKRKVNELLDLNAETQLTPVTNFMMDSCLVWTSRFVRPGGEVTIVARYVNLRRVRYEFHETMTGRGSHQVEVEFQNYMRVVELRMTFPASSKGKKYYDVDIVALPPHETITFLASGASWRASSHR